MSIAEFSTALKNKAIREWFNTEKNARESYSKENINTLTNAASIYRSAEQTASKTSFIITKDTIRDLIVELHGLDSSSTELEDLTNVYFNEFGRKNSGVVVNRKKINVGEGIPAVYFQAISFDSITNLVNNVMNLKTGALSKKFEKGHVIGLNTELLRVTANRISNIDGRAAQGASSAKEVLLSHLDNVIEYYKRLDYDSANIQPAEDVKLYASVNKTIFKSGKTKYLVELQPKAKNQKSAQEVKSTIGSIRKLFDPGALTEKQMLGVIDNLITSVSDSKFQQDLLEMKSSPSFIEMITTHIATTITGKTVDQAYVHRNVEIATKKVPKVNLKGLRAAIAVEVKKAKDAKTKVSQATSIKTLKGSTISLPSLLMYLNSNLQNVISANMGDGNEKGILNYRSGRFASSAKVERLSESRAGMITAFYSYMKNPYQTFEPGFAQGSPASRNPKNLIGASIREIAATKVSNQLRAVSV